MPELNLKGLSLRELEEFALSLGEKSYRGRQLFEWIYTKEISDFSGMTTMSLPLRKRLAGLAVVEGIMLKEKQRSREDGTTKYLFELSDGSKIESVLIPPRAAFRDPGPEAGMPARPGVETATRTTAEMPGESGSEAEEEQQRLTLCISTQVGCPLDCTFCATASMGFTRNLTAGEIVDQVLGVRQASGKKVTNLVYMGMGEPLMNYDEVMKSAEIVSTGMGIVARRITISTAGWVPGITRMGEEGRKFRLAVSLHTLNETARRELMPVSKKYPLTELLAAVTEYCRKTKQRVTFEYVLFDGWNDTPEDARALAALTKRIPSKINIIPYHDIGFALPAGERRELRPTPREGIEKFAAELRKMRTLVFVRSSAGEEIRAACGQLAVKHEGRTVPNGKRRRSTSPDSNRKRIQK